MTRIRSNPALFIAIAVMLAVLPSLAFARGEAEGPAATAVPATNEAPQLRALVEANQLPPLEERIPTNPMVVEPFDGIGRYGGEIRSALIGAGDGAWLARTVQYDGLVLWNYEWSEVIPAAAARFEVSDDAREFTFELREGLRWDDGEPVTTADVEYWYEYELLHEDLNARHSGTFRAGGEYAEIEIINETTFRVIFPEPNGLFLMQLASVNPWFPTPKHYASQFHADFNSDIHKIAEDEGYEDWADYYSYNVIWHGMFVNSELPTIRAWKFVSGFAYTGDQPVVRLERNPYYYRVDTEGNQLPYVDTWVFDILEDSEVLLLRTMAGDVDVIHRHINTVPNRPTLFDNQQRGDYRLVGLDTTNTSMLAINLNMTYDDDNWRELVRNRDFRIGLSHAIDRDELNELLYAGMAVPRQPAPTEAQAWYNPEMETQFIEFDLDLANEYFDRAGLEVDSAGRRLGPDGNPIVLPFLLNAAQDDQIAGMEIITSHLARVGIEVQIDTVDGSLHWDRLSTNQAKAFTMSTGRAGRDAITSPHQFLPATGSSISPRWAAWWLGSEHVQPEEPPESMRRRIELYDRLIASPPEEHDELMSQIVDIAAEEFEWIGTVGRVPSYGIWHNRLGNTPPEGEQPESWPYPNPAPADLSQLYIRY